MHDMWTDRLHMYRDVGGSHVKYQVVWVKKEQGLHQGRGTVSRNDRYLVACDNNAQGKRISSEAFEGNLQMTKRRLRRQSIGYELETKVESGWLCCMVEVEHDVRYPQELDQRRKGLGLRGRPGA